jgi:hypothetical protein
MPFTIQPMTTKERLHKLVDELSERDAAAARIVIDEEIDTSTDSPEMLPVPTSWGWDRTSWGEPMPNVVAWVDQSRQGH